MAVAAATLGTYSRCNPKTIGDILSDKSDTIMALIKAFPFEYEPQQQTTEYLIWYGFALQAMGQFIGQAKYPKQIVQLFVDERFGQFEHIYSMADQMTMDILEYYEEETSLLDKLNSPSNMAFTKQEMNVLSSQYVLQQIYRLINCIKSKLTAKQNEELVTDYDYDDMKPVREFFIKRVGGEDVKVEQLFYFVDDIVENIHGIHANVHNLNSDDVLEMMTDDSEIFFRSYKKEPHDIQKWMEDPFYADHPDTGFAKNAFQVSEAWNEVFRIQTSNDDKQEEELEAYAVWLVEAYQEEEETERKQVLMEIMQSFSVRNEAI